MDSRVERTLGKAAARGPGQARWWLVDPVRWWIVEQEVPHSCADKPGGTIGERNRLCNPGLQCREVEPQTL